MDEWAEVFSSQLHFAQWMIDRESSRVDMFHQRASYLLGFDGVILAILPVVLAPIASTNGGTVRDASWALALLAAVSFVLAVLAAVQTMNIRPVREVPLLAIQRRWVTWSTNLHMPDAAQVLADQANSLYGSESTTKDSALLAIRAEADVRARQLRIAFWSSAIGVTALGGLFITLMAARV